MKRKLLKLLMVKVCRVFLSLSAVLMTSIYSNFIHRFDALKKILKSNEHELDIAHTHWHDTATKQNMAADYHCDKMQLVFF